MIWGEERRTTRHSGLLAAFMALGLLATTFFFSSIGSAETAPVSRLDWTDTNIVGIELVRMLDLTPYAGGSEPRPANCDWAGEVIDYPGLYCVDSALPAPDDPDYDELLYMLHRRMAGEVITLEHARSWNLDFSAGNETR